MKSELTSPQQPAQTQPVVLRAPAGAADPAAPTLTALHEAVVRYVYYAFVFSVPFEAVAAQFMGLLNDTVAKAIGLLLAALTLFRPRRYYGQLPRPLFVFIAYLTVYLIYSSVQGTPLLTENSATLIQLLTLFWMTFNIMSTPRLRAGTLYSLVLSCSLLALLQALGLTTEEIAQGRVSAVGVNANTLSAVLAMGLIALTGLAFGRGSSRLAGRVLFASSAIVITIEIVRTGSRASALALVAGVMIFVLKKSRSLLPKLKIAIVAAIVVGVLAALSFRSEAVRMRWDASIERGSMAGREVIFPTAWEMFQEKPVFGWGPTTHLIELGRRLGLPKRDPHNLYLWILNEVGLLGAFFFFGGLLWCARAAWKARMGGEGILPLSMLLCMLIVNANGTYHYDKLFWVTLAYVLASAGAVRTRMRRTAGIKILFTRPFQPRVVKSSPV
jgi:O-antigen ligase